LIGWCCCSVCSGGYRIGGGGGGGDPCARGGGQEVAHICDGMERMAMPKRWPFLKTPEHKSNIEDMEDKVGWARTLAMKRMIARCSQQAHGRRRVQCKLYLQITTRPT
jgi:hypothetical protein